MLELRIVKTLETVLARVTRCGMFLARFYNARLREFQYFIMKKLEAVSGCKASLIMYRLRIVKTLETVLARVTRCGMFLARFYNARLREFQYFIMKKLEAVSGCKASLIMYRLRIVKTLETVLARVTRCGMFLARFYNARLREFQYSIMKKFEAVSGLQKGGFLNAFI